MPLVKNVLIPVWCQRFEGKRRRYTQYQGKCWEWQRCIPPGSWCTACYPLGAGCQRLETETNRKEREKKTFALCNFHQYIIYVSDLLCYHCSYHSEQNSSKSSIDGIQPRYLFCKSWQVRHDSSNPACQW